MPDCEDCTNDIPDVQRCYDFIMASERQPPFFMTGWKYPGLLNGFPGLYLHVYEDCFFFDDINSRWYLRQYWGGAWKFEFYRRNCFWVLPEKWRKVNYWSYRNVHGVFHSEVYSGKLYAGNLTRTESRGIYDSWRNSYFGGFLVILLFYCLKFILRINLFYCLWNFPTPLLISFF